MMSLVSPMLRTEACKETHQSSQHYFNKGHETGAHFTTFQLKDSYAWARTESSTQDNKTSALKPGLRVTARAVGAVGGYHNHTVGMAHGK